MPVHSTTVSARRNDDEGSGGGSLGGCIDGSKTMHQRQKSTVRKGSTTK